MIKIFNIVQFIINYILYMYIILGIHKYIIIPHSSIACTIHRDFINKNQILSSSNRIKIKYIRTY